MIYDILYIIIIYCRSQEQKIIYFDKSKAIERICELMSSWGDDNDGTGTMIPVRRNDGHMFHGFKIRGISLIVRTLERTLLISKKHFRFDITLDRFQDRTPTTRGTFHDVGQLGEIWTNFEGEVEFQALAVQHLKRRSHQNIFSELIFRAFLKRWFHHSQKTLSNN